MEIEWREEVRVNERKYGEGTWVEGTEWVKLKREVRGEGWMREIEKGGKR